MDNETLYPNLNVKNKRFRLATSRDSASLSLVIMDSIVGDLLANRLKPGDRLPTEPELCEKYGVSRNTVREAIKMLSILGLIKIKRGDGTYIAESISTMSVNPLLLGLALEPRTSWEIIELRHLLDTGVFELLVDKADDADIDRLEEMNNNILKMTESGNVDIDVLFKMDLDFHKACYELNKNRLLIYLYNALYEMFAPSIKESVSHDPGSIYRNHAVIIKALRTRDKNMVRTAVLETLKHWRTIIK